MIIDALISILTGTVKLIFGVFPSLPAMSTSIVSAGDYAVTMISGFVGFFGVIYGTVLLTAIFVMLLALLLFDQIYFSTLWVIKKIPVLNIK